jgi:hypothetical protein
VSDRDEPFRDEPFGEAADALRAPVRLDASFDERVMASVRDIARERQRSRRGVWNRMSQPRTITVRPSRLAFAAACVILAAVLAGYGAHAFSQFAAAGAPRATASAAAGGAERVQFVLVAPDAKSVAIAGDFNGWDAHHAGYQAVHRGGGVWSVTARVPVGHHRYSFVVDDSVWVADPAAPRVVDDDFGTTNSAIVVEPEDR